MQLQLLLRLFEPAVVGDDGFRTACAFSTPRFTAIPEHSCHIQYFGAGIGIYFGARSGNAGHSCLRASRPHNFG
jgi:hypothetical protein